MLLRSKLLRSALLPCFYGLYRYLYTPDRLRRKSPSGSV
uniref:Uncharacterized protein n=1 Tax=Schistosoma curassoni TaxID=6186 RepID=A0A183L6I4_9TREM